MIEKKIIRRTLKLTGIILCVIGVLLTTFHFWFRDHAEEVIEELVSARSNGKVNLKLRKFRFNYFSRKMELQNALFYTTDSLDTPTAYRFKIAKIRIELHSFWQLVFHGKLDIESLTLINPEVEAIRLKHLQNTNHREISISQEMGRIYNSIHDALDFLNAKKFLIQEGTFSVINKIESGKMPIVISHIHFLVDKNEYDTAGNLIASHPDPDNMILRTHSQDIQLPDGKHRLSFRNLRINIRKQSIEMDSCTITGEKADVGHTAFRFFFDTLHLSTVDFSALYRNDIIKADSVYCTKPTIQLVLELKDKSNKKTPLPSLKTIIQPLTGDLQLGYAGIRNADIHVVTIRNDHVTTFTSQNDNIEINGLHINSDSTDPLEVKSFAMAIRDYETLSRDSTLAYRFDSVKFNNNSVTLSNFTVRTLPGKTLPEVERSYSVPRLELSNLSWDELLFNRNIKATKAILYNPVVHYKRMKPRKQNQRLMLFRDLGNIDAVTELQQLQIVDGQLNMDFDQRTKIVLQDADLLVSSNELLGSRNIKSIQRSLTRLQFARGLLTVNELQAELHQVHFTGKEDQLEAAEVIVSDPSKTLSATARNVVINELYYTDSTRSISVDGLEWQEATVNLGALPRESKPSRSSITIRNIAGNNTRLILQNPIQTISTSINSLAIEELKKPAGGRTSLTGLHASGKDFHLTRNGLWLETGIYDFADKKISEFNDACLQNDGSQTSLNVEIKKLQFVPDIAQIMNGIYHFEEVQAGSPLIYLKTKNKSGADSIHPNRLTDLSIARLEVNNPTIYLELQDSSGDRFVKWSNNGDGDAQNKWTIINLALDRSNKRIRSSSLLMNGSQISFSGPKNLHFTLDHGNISIDARNLELTMLPANPWDWSIDLNTVALNNLNPFLLKNGATLTLSDVRASNINLNPHNTTDLAGVLRSNNGLRLYNSDGSYTDSNQVFNWHNLAFNQSARTLSLDSFNYRPQLSRDSFVQAHPFQVDYITAGSGKTLLRKIDLAAYLNEKAIKAEELVLDQPVLTAYRDATRPFRHGYTKNLPTIAIRKIPFPFSLDKLTVNEGKVIYMQVDRKTLKQGTIPVTRLNAELTKIQNEDTKAGDSLTLSAGAMLMDQIPLHLWAKESYEDSLAGLQIKLQISAADLRVLNPALIPLVSAKLKSGYLDSLRMDVKANDNLAIGEMKMNYHHLSIAVLKKGNDGGKTLLTRLANFAANTLFLKHKNTGRTGVVYFERNKERSFFHYLVKMTIDGIANNAGLKKEKKKVSRYNRTKLNKK